MRLSCLPARINPFAVAKINHNVTHVTLPCTDRNYFLCRDKGDAMLIETYWPAVGVLIAALPMIGAGIWAAVAAHHHQKRADHWAQFRPVR